MAYRQMASLYDQFMAHAPYDDWVEFTEEIFRLSETSIKNIADLGCGTGEITIRLAKKNYSLIGVDYASEMLTHAEQKATKEKLPIQWIHQDLRELSGLNQLDAVVSYCDVINYITSEEEVGNVFNKIAASLKEEGLFIFDVHALAHVENRLMNQSFTDVNDDIAYIWNCIEGEESGEMYHDLTFFTLREEGLYDRFDEYHHQRTFPVKVYEQLLYAAGFEKPKVYYDFSLKNKKSDETTERIFIVTKKRSR